MKTYLKKFSQYLFKTLKSNDHEQLSIVVHSEESLFLRWNNALIRQNTNVTQHECCLHFYCQKRIIESTFNLTLDLETDLTEALRILNSARTQLPLIDPHPHYAPLKNNGTSEVCHSSSYPSDNEIPQLIHQLFQGTDMAGLWCSGPVRRASLNSEGQFHYYENNFFFLDYSIYEGPLAVKGYFSESQFNAAQLQEQLEKNKAKLKLLQQPRVDLKPGKYKVYLEPMAMAEILWALQWSSFSEGYHRRVQGPLEKLRQKKESLSSLIHIRENFELGLAPLFNSLGEMTPLHLDLIQGGHLKSLLTSHETGLEYGLPANGAEKNEKFRSLELKPGILAESQILEKLGTGLYISNLHYLNFSNVAAAQITGMTRFACFFVKEGKIQGPIQDLRFDESLYNLFGAHLICLSEETQTFVNLDTYQKRSLGGLRTPGALIENFNFTL